MLGGIVSSLVSLVISYLLVPNLGLVLTIKAEVAYRIFHFGKWIFVSTVIYFLATNGDRLYLAGVVSLTALGVYGIARSLADILFLLVSKGANLIIFPMVAAASSGSIRELRQRIARNRPALLTVAALGTSLFGAASELIVAVLYDARYEAAAKMLPILAVGVWFSILATINESVLLGISRPVYGAIANSVKLGVLAVGLPLVAVSYGILGAVYVIALSEAVRYVPLWWFQRREHLSFGRQDMILTFAMFAMLVAWRGTFNAMGLTADVRSLLPIPL
jgi:O-antigen/teichoic acid export membrane protein